MAWFHAANFEGILDFPRDSVGIGQAKHRGLQGVSRQHELQIMVVGKGSVLVGVVRRAVDRIGHGAASAGNQIDDAVLLEAFVIVDVPRNHHERRPAFLALGLQ